MASSSKAADDYLALLSSLPPGFRFHPTEEELVNHYLKKKKIHGEDFGHVNNLIPEIDFIKFEPWDLPQQSLKSNNEWFFFNQLEQKWKKSERIERRTRKGRWKSIGTNRDVTSKDENSRSVIGKRKILTYYLRGRTKKDSETKTDWVLHEYHDVSDESLPNHNQRELVLCRLKNYGSHGLAHDMVMTSSNSKSLTDYSLLLSRLPVGFRFQPTYEELVDYYLRNKIHDNDGIDSEQVDSIISEIDFYKYEPWELPAKSRSKSNEEWFFFTHLNRYKNTKNISRATKEGTWKSNGNERDVTKEDNSESVIGKRKLLTFYLGGQIKTNWVMHEYSLVSRANNQEIILSKIGDLVLCKLRNNADDKVHVAESDKEDIDQQDFFSTEVLAREPSPKSDCNCLYSSIAADDRELTEIVNSLLVDPEPDSYTLFNHSTTMQI